MSASVNVTKIVTSHFFSFSLIFLAELYTLSILNNMIFAVSVFLASRHAGFILSVKWRSVN